MKHRSLKARLSTLKKKSKLTLPAMADKFKVPHGTFLRWYYGINPPNKYAMADVEKVLKRSKV